MPTRVTQLLMFVCYVEKLRVANLASHDIHSFHINLSSDMLWSFRRFSMTFTTFGFLALFL